MQFPGLAGELDVRWRPLWNIRHSGYTERLFARTDELNLQGQAVCVPAVSDQLFLALARCEPWDGDESFSRLLEASLLLKHHLSEVDWPYVDTLIEQYGLEVPARFSRRPAAAFRHRSARRGTCRAGKRHKTGKACRVARPEN